MTFGAMLEQRIRSLGVDRADVLRTLTAQGVVTSRSTLWNWLNNANRPSHANLRALLDALMVFGDAERLAFYEAAAVPPEGPENGDTWDEVRA